MGAYKLLSVESDAKTTKGSKRGYLTGILYLSPANEASPRHNLCPMATEECKQACLYTAGRAAIFSSIGKARLARTRMYLENTWLFFEFLRDDIETLISSAKRKGMTPCVRINGTSDLPQLALKLARLYPSVQFYDYTKIPRAWTRERSNYRLTFSCSGSNLQDCIEAINHGVSVSVVFTGKLPDQWLGTPVINGDTSDLRFLDARGVIVGLKAKGKARGLQTGGFLQCGPVAQEKQLIQIERAA